MITLPYIEIAVCIALLALAAVSALCNPFFRKIRKAEGNGGDIDVSVVVIDNGDGETTERCLRSVLAQEYSARFEVILVTERKNPISERIIHLIDDKRLSAVYVPHSPLFMSRNKLAVSLGIKAAKNDWIVLLKGNAVPQSTVWLRGMMQQAGDDKDIIIAPENFDEHTSSFKRYLRLRRSMYALRKASRGRAFCSYGSNIAFRRKMFLDGDGYRGTLQHTSGEYDFIVNKYATKQNTAVAISRDCMAVETKPTRREWRQSEKQRIHVRRNMKHGFCTKATCFLDMFLLYVSLVAAVGAIVYASLATDYILLSAGIASLLLGIVLRAIFFQKAKKQYNLHSSRLPTACFLLLVTLYEILVPLHNALYSLRYALTDAREFSTHKL